MSQSKNLNTDVINLMSENARVQYEGGNPFLMQDPRRLQTQEDRRIAQNNGQIGKFDNVPNDQKPDPERITAGITGCVVVDCAEHLRDNYKKWYGETLHQFARGSIKGDSYGRFQDGEPIRTSLLVRDVQHEDGTRFLYTLNSVYEVLS
jgi:hypothetical protein